MEQLEGCYGCRSLARRVTEADATSEALQARVNELEDGTTALLNQQSERLAVENEKLTMALSQLAQRTAELEAAKRDRDELQSVFDLGHTRTVEADKLWQDAHGKPEVWPDLGDLVGWLIKRHDDVRAELERVRDQFADLRKMVAALPKVEGAVVVSNGYVKDSTRCHALFGADEDAALYAALLQHRQGMEG